MDWPKPKLVISKCLGIEACRWNGLMAADPFVELLKPHVELFPVCPECEIGLGVPRHPVRVVRSKDPACLFRLLQPATGGDFTRPMLEFSSKFLGSLPEVDGFLLKFKSPSCGLSNVNIYSRVDKGDCCLRGAGFFGGLVKEGFPELPAEDEGRLHGFSIREHFLTRIFLGARLRLVVASGRMGALVEFHSNCKYLLMAYGQTSLTKLGRIVASGSKGAARETIGLYQAEFRKALSKEPRYQSSINALQHMMGYFSGKVSAAETAFFLDLLEDFRRGSTPLSVPVGVLKSWALRFEEKYILSQFFLRPYPEALVAISDSGKGRSL